MMKCPKCGAILDPAQHGDLIFDGRVWCDRCHEYGRELIRPRELREIQAWSRMICQELGFPPVLLEDNAAPSVSRPGAPVLMAEADHRGRSIRFYAPGCRLATLCHELAHIYTGQDHTRDWAMMFAKLVAWVKTRLGEDHGPQGFRARLSIYAGVPQGVYESGEPPATTPGSRGPGHEPGPEESYMIMTKIAADGKYLAQCRICGIWVEVCPEDPQYAKAEIFFEVFPFFKGGLFPAIPCSFPPLLKGYQGSEKTFRNRYNAAEILHSAMLLSE